MLTASVSSDLLHLPSSTFSTLVRFGFVTFDDVATAEKALKQYNGTSVDGREISLRFAEERSEGGGGGGGGGGFGRGRGGRGGGFGRGGGGGGGFGRGGRGGGGGFGRGGGRGMF